MTQSFLDLLRDKGLDIGSATATDPDEVSFPDPSSIKTNISAKLFQRISHESPLNLTLIPGENAVIGRVKMIRRRAGNIGIVFARQEPGTPQLLSINVDHSELARMVRT